MKDKKTIKMKKRKTALANLHADLKKEKQSEPIQFNEFLDIAASQPNLAFRNIFQLFHDMMHYYVPEGVNKYPNDPDGVGFIDYDCSRLFTQGVDIPFFADRSLSTRLMTLVKGFKKGLQDNPILLFMGSPGSGKSIFLNNLLSKFEEFTRIPEGKSYETLWKLDVEKLGGFSNPMREDDSLEKRVNNTQLPEKYLDVPCPNHDHPIFQIPKPHRRKFLDELIPDGEFKERLFKEKEYEWVFQGNACSICTSLNQRLLRTLGDPQQVFEMLYAQRRQFNRQLGQGISVFNCGDQVIKKPHTNPFLQKMLSRLLKDSNAVKYIFSNLAKTNDGIFALMDVKGNNCARFQGLHGIASDGVQKVEDAEEYINSLFIGLINPEDTEIYQKTASFRDRVMTVKVPYVLDYNTEVEIYQSKFSRDLESLFLPRVLESFAKVIISSRLNPNSEALGEWIKKPEQYEKYLDQDLLLLKMALNARQTPAWLSEEDRKEFTSGVRKKLLAESESEGMQGFSGRQSIKTLNEFLSRYWKPGKPITMDMLRSFFQHKRELDEDVLIPEGFLESLVHMYDFTVLQEVKESLYYYNEDKISHDVQNYLYAINFPAGTKEQCPYTGDVIEITHEYLDDVEEALLGESSDSMDRELFRDDMQRTYVSKTLANEIQVEKKSITETEQYQSLFARYIHNIKENVLTPLMTNPNFRRAIQDFRTPSFSAYDKRLQQDVPLLIGNLQSKFHYTAEGAKQVCLYVLDKGLAEEFSL